MGFGGGTLIVGIEVAGDFVHREELPRSGLPLATESSAGPWRWADLECGETVDGRSCVRGKVAGSGAGGECGGVGDNALGGVGGLDSDQ